MGSFKIKLPKVSGFHPIGLQLSFFLDSLRRGSSLRLPAELDMSMPWATGQMIVCNFKNSWFPNNCYFSHWNISLINIFCLSLTDKILEKVFQKFSIFRLSCFMLIVLFFQICSFMFFPIAKTAKEKNATACCLSENTVVLYYERTSIFNYAIYN